MFDFDYSVWIDQLLPLLQSPIGAALFVPFYALWVIFLLPGIWASMLAGVIYGTWYGSLLVFLGAFIGAEVSFLFGRTFLRKWVQLRISKWPKIEAIQKAVSREGLRLVLLTRLSPAFPFSILNFVYGLSEISFRDYSFGLIGILPGTILFCGLGSIAGDLARFSEVLDGRSDLPSFLIRLVGLIATLFVIWFVSRAIRTALQDFESSI